MRKRATERARIESSRGWAIYLAIFQHPASFRRMLVVGQARPGSAAGHGHELEGGTEKGDGGISQGISGISPRGGLVNCSVGTGGKKWGRGREGGRDAQTCGCTRSGDRSESCGREKTRTNREQERGHKSRQSYGLKEAYRPIAVIHSCGCIRSEESPATPRDEEWRSRNAPLNYPGPSMQRGYIWMAMNKNTVYLD